MNRKLASLILFVATLTGVLVFAPKTEAVTNIFLNPSSPAVGGHGTGSNTISAVVEYADAVSVPDVNFKWFVPSGYASNPNIILRNFCAPGRDRAYMNVEIFNPNNGSWNFAGAYISNFTAPGYVNLCVGNDLVVNGVSRSNFVPQIDPPYPGGPDRYPGSEVLLVTVHIYNRAVFGDINKFNIEVSSGTYITQAELPEMLAAVPNQPAGGGFAILGNYPAAGNSYGYNATFTFKPSCSYFSGGSSRDAYLHWRDADGWASYGNQTSWGLWDRTAGAYVTASDPNNVYAPATIVGPGLMLGELSNQHKSRRVNMQINHIYEWRWFNLNHLNTVHVWMSFSEMNVNTANCVTDNATCQILSISPASVAPGGTYTVTIRANNTGGTTWVPGQWNLGSQQGQTNNHVTNGGGRVTAIWGAGGNVAPGGSRNFTFTTTAPGTAGTYPTGWRMVREGVAWFGTACTSNLTVVPMITINGTVYNAYNMATRYNNVGIDYTCDGAADTTTNASGFYSFSVPQGTNFCVRVRSGLPGGATLANTRVRPWSEGYVAGSGCNGFGGANPYPGGNNYCLNNAPVGNTYECQAAGVNNGVVSCLGVSRDFDRNSNTGYDFVVRIPPQVRCNDFTVAAQEINSPFNVTIRIEHTSTINTPDSAGNVTITTAGVTSPSTPYSVTRGSFTDVVVTHPGTGIAGYYPITATVTGSGDAMNNTVNPTTCFGNIPIGNKSYLKVFGGDVRAGGGFTNTGSCLPATGGGIRTFAENRGGLDYAGSSAQFSVTSLLTVNEFYSASQRTGSNTLPAKGLTISNTIGDPTYGGDYGAAQCITDYYDETKDPTITLGTIVPAVFSPGRQQYDLGAVDITLPARTIPRGSQVAIFVEGDVFISGNITYDTAARTVPTDIPYFVLVAKGTITISTNVTRLDGLYIAQAQDDGTEGVIKTCVTPANADYTAATLYAGCSTRQLSINGGLIARDIKFQRVRGTLDQAVVREYPTFNAAGNLTGGSNAAEIINYTPEMWLAPSPLKNAGVIPGSGGSGSILLDYDAFRILPPIY